MNTIECPTHGTAKATSVCQHVARGFVARQRVGFFWTSHDPGNPTPNAWCSACENRVRRTGGFWAGEAAEQLQPKPMCVKCYELAKEFHMGGNPWA
jgi:hypothetical protein